MEILEGFEAFSLLKTDRMAFTIGNFDGLHLGHQEIIRTLVSRAGVLGVPSCLVTFSRHSRKHLDSADHPSLLLDYPAKKKLLSGMGVDIFLELEFDKNLASMKPDVFLDLLAGDREYCSFIVGDDFVFGRGKAGNADFISSYFPLPKREVISVPHVFNEGSRISSTRIRSLLSKGNVVSVNRLTGHDYYIRGVRQSGENVGEMLGFPTINMGDIPVMLPGNGVYSTRTEVAERIFNSMSYIGQRLTFKKNIQVVESHLFDFNEAVPVGTAITVYFERYLREDRKFDSQDELVRQLKKDRDQAILK